MRVAIAQVDGKWPNLALAKLAAWERAQGNRVDRFNPLFSGAYPVVYASKVFVDTPDDPYLPDHAIRGGSGYNVELSLAADQEAMRPLWELWPEWQRDMGYSTRGCVRRCPFCVVPKKDGRLRVVAEFGDLWSGRDELVLLDGNVTAAPIEHFRRLCKEATAARCRLDFSQGLDARLLTDEHAAILAHTRYGRRLHLAFDNMTDEPAVRAAIATFGRAGIPPSRLSFYVLVGFDTTHAENLERIEILRALGADPFVMPFDRSDPYQRRLARWVNNKVAFKAMGWPQWCATFRSEVAVP